MKLSTARASTFCASVFCLLLRGLFGIAWLILSALQSMIVCSARRLVSALLNGAANHSSRDLLRYGLGCCRQTSLKIGDLGLRTRVYRTCGTQAIPQVYHPCILDMKRGALGFLVGSTFAHIRCFALDLSKEYNRLLRVLIAPPVSLRRTYLSISRVHHRVMLKAPVDNVFGKDLLRGHVPRRFDNSLWFSNTGSVFGNCIKGVV